MAQQTEGHVCREFSECTDVNPSLVGLLLIDGITQRLPDFGMFHSFEHMVNNNAAVYLMI